MAHELFEIGIKAVIKNLSGQILLVHIPAWDGNPEYWDLPGGRIDEGEGFLETLSRELKEEVSVTKFANPRQLMSVLSGVKITVGDKRLPLVLIVYEVDLEDITEVRQSSDSNEDDIGWFTREEASQKLKVKFNSEFCQRIAQS